LSGRELELLQDAFASNWIAPLGPHVDAFERELAARCRVGHAAALSSGTAGLHLALLLAGVGRGDEVWCSDLTFAASANAVVYCGATPVFFDAHPETWTLDPALVAEALADAARRGRLPKALVAVDLYGQPCDYATLEPLCAEHGVGLVSDAAEALGSRARDAAGRECPAGSFGRFAVLSFNGNKILTTSGGGALLSDDADAVARARKLASQAREPAPHYEHVEVGYNYRLSNLLAAVGRGQLEVLDDRMAARRRNFARYRELLGDLPGVGFMPEATYAHANRWLSVVTLDPDTFGADREAVRLALEADDVEARPLWKPMHLQPVFAGCRVVGGTVGERLFAVGLCLPSGSAMTDADLERVAGLVRACHGG
jgi:pyridoxal phosphate-dependent aminotransferase EpsN